MKPFKKCFVGGWAMTRLTYSKEQAYRIYLALEQNERDIAKAFRLVCHDDVFARINAASAPLILERIVQMHAYMVIIGRTFESIWEDMTDRIKRNTYERQRIHNRTV